MADITIGGVSPLLKAATTEGGSASGGGGEFADMLKQVVSSAAQDVRGAEVVASKAVVGDASLDELALAMTNAEMMLRTIVAVRDRVISAYQDIIKMPI